VGTKDDYLKMLDAHILNPRYEYYGIEYYGPVKRAIRRLTQLNPKDGVPGIPGVLFDDVLDGLTCDVFVKTTQLKRFNKILDPRGLLFRVLVQVGIDYLQRVGDMTTLMKIRSCSKSAFAFFSD
jgi:hypothetical protein